MVRGAIFGAVLGLAAVAWGLGVSAPDGGPLPAAHPSTGTHMGPALAAMALPGASARTAVAGTAVPVRFPLTLISARQSPDTLTYHNRISRVLQANCVGCHRSGGIAPFALDDYRTVAAFRRTIEHVVRQGTMPPWYANPAYGEWANDRSVPEADRQALFAWIAAGAPEGDPGDAPAPRTYVDGWNIGEPDAVFSLPEPVRIPAEGVVPYQSASVQTHFPEDRWVRAVEIRPTAPEVTHHVLVFVEAPGGRSRDGGAQGFFAATAPGAVGMDFGDGRAKRLPAGATLRFQLHYTPNGREAFDQSRIGFIFADDPPDVEVETRSAINTRFEIPPHTERHEVSGDHRFTEDGEIIAFFPHTHVRGVAFRYELIQPDGIRETLLDVPRYNFDWQLTYHAARPLRAPAGSVLRATAWYDNSASNPFNPDPSVPVRFGQQTWEEMMIGYFDWVRRSQP